VRIRDRQIEELGVMFGVLEHVLEQDRMSDRAALRSEGLLNATHVLVFRYVALHPECTVGAIAAGTGISQASATKSVDRLVHLGWVARREGELDRRMAIMTLTDLGTEVWCEREARERTRWERIVSQMGPGELRNLLKGLKGLLGVRLAQEPEVIAPACQRCGPSCHDDCVVFLAHLAIHGTPIESP
jgi:DNA-binding MarR family transcriptional regulator